MFAKHGLVAIVRWDSKDGLVLAPPGASDDGEWFEGGGELKSVEDMRAKLAEVGAVSVLDQLVPPAPIPATDPTPIPTMATHLWTHQ